MNRPRTGPEIGLVFAAVRLVVNLLEQLEYSHVIMALYS